MIVVKLMGGLGNQMFQYAAGRALALKHATELRIDLSFLNQAPNGAYTKRKLELDAFVAPLSFATTDEINSFDLPSSRLQRVLKKILPEAKDKRVAKENGLGYQAYFDELPAHTYLDGYWQNEKYFVQQRAVLLADFTPKESMPTEISQYLQLIQNKTAISMHVRRGDYVALQSAKDFHGSCDISYYQKALEVLKSKVGAAQIFVFSDDIAWCKENFKQVEGIVFVEHSCAAVWDLLLMSKCNHNIIANSSFSWWAAWLNRHTNKIVIMPQQWFTGMSSQQIGINPKDWILL